MTPLEHGHWWAFGGQELSETQGEGISRLWSVGVQTSPKGSAFLQTQTRIKYSRRAEF